MKCNCTVKRGEFRYKQYYSGWRVYRIENDLPTHYGFFKTLERAIHMREFKDDR